MKRQMKRHWMLFAGAVLLMGAFVTETPIATLDIDEVTVGTSVTALTDTLKSTEVLIRNRSDQILCVKVAVGQDDCTTPAVTMTCTADTAAAIDNDLWVIDAATADTLLKPAASTLCGKQPAASGNSKVIRVIETVPQ